MHTESSKLLAHLFNHRLDDLNPDFVGGLELGAVPLTAIVITGASRSSKGFMVRKSPKGRGGRKTNNPPGIEEHPLQVAAVSSFSRMSPRPGALHPSR